MEKNERLTITESGFLFDHRSGVTYTLNQTAGSIMEMLIAGKDPDEILKTVLERYEVDEREARFDLESFVFQVKKYSLL
jgi:hypothetical protein